MPASQLHITERTPMGANLIGDGATFRVWAPRAEHVHVALNGVDGYQPSTDDELVKDGATGHWRGFFPAVRDGTRYRYFVVGPGGAGFKRDPWARELELYGYPDCDALVRAPDSYPWHDEGFRPPAHADLVVYQLHIGVFNSRDDRGRDARPYRVAKFLDALDRIEYLADLGINAIQPLPFAEFQGEWSLGYNGTDLFSPEMDYSVAPEDLEAYLSRVNELLKAKGQAALGLHQLTGQVNQLKAFIDICHLYGIAVLPDVVYNHAGGGFDRQSIDHFDFPASPGAENNLYFSSEGWAGGRVFAFHRPDVRSFLIENAKALLDEYHADGLRFDEVSVIDDKGGWFFCQDLTETLRFHKTSAVLIAEYWGRHRWLAIRRPPEGMGFDVAYSDELRNAVRAVLAQAASGAEAHVDLAAVRRGLQRPHNFALESQAYNCLENHDLVLDADGHRSPRIARLADGSNSRSWYARSRARVATALLLTAPGVPMLFMGQEFLEDKLWSDDPHRADLLIWWDGVEGRDRHMADFYHCTRDLIRLRLQHPALRSDPIAVHPPHNRVLAFHRWVPDDGDDIVVAINLAETTLHDHTLGFPHSGHWAEVFNSDFYDHFPNSQVQGNHGRITVEGPPSDGLPHSACVTLPANSAVVFAA